MFGFNNKVKKEREAKKEQSYLSEFNRIRELNKKYEEWQLSDEYKRFNQLQTLIIKAYESVNIEADLLGVRIDEIFTREDYLEDFKVFFRPEVFNKLKEWCKEYEILREKENYF